MKHDHWSRPIRARLHTIARYVYDANRYIRHSSAARRPTRPWQRHAYLMKLAHVIEKGLALPESRPNFGEENLRQLAVLLRNDLKDRSTANVMALNALASYIAFHEMRGAEPLPVVREVLAEAEAAAPIPRGDSLLDIDREHLASLSLGAEAFMRSRHSVRQFAGTPVDREALRRAVALAQTTPSVCNRQAGRVHFIADRTLMDRALELQGGNRGFGHTVGVVAVVTCELGSFLEPNERNQAYVDGGMFAMALLLGLHAQTLGACPLNWSRNPLTDIKLRNALTIPDSETIIMLIGIGNLLETCTVAGSSRLPTDLVYEIIDTPQPSNGGQ